MAKIIVYGDIDIASLYLSVDGCKEITVSGKKAQIFPLEAGSHEIAATTITKIERSLQGLSGSGFLSAASAALQEGTNTTIGGILNFAEDDVLLIEVKQTLLKTNVYSKMVSEQEAASYVDLSTATTYNGRKSKKKFRWLAWLLFIVLGILAFMFVMVWFAAMSPAPH